MKNSDSPVHNITSKDLIFSFWLSQTFLFLLASLFIWLFYLRRGYNLVSFFSTDNLLGIGVGGFVVAILGICLQWVAWKIFSLSAFDDGGINRLILTLSITTLSPMFAFGAISEEILVRGVIQTGVVSFLGPLAGIIITSLIFTAMHFRYLKKPVLISGVFILSLILGTLYNFTGTLWSSIWAHFLYNLGSAYLAKKYYLPYIETKD